MRDFLSANLSGPEYKKPANIKFAGFLYPKRQA